MIWCVDDDSTIRDIEVYTLTQTGFEAKGFPDGLSMLEALKTEKPELIVLDIMMPGMDGVEVLKEIRGNTETRKIPVIMATAKGTEMDKIQGLDTGADDYLVKPFDMLELIARVNLILKRYKKDTTVFSLAGVDVDMVSQKVVKAGEEIILTPQEWSLLEVLIRNVNIALSRDKLLNMAWGYDFEGDARTVDVHVVKLRKKLGWEDQIKTLYKLGYRLETGA